MSTAPHKFQPGQSGNPAGRPKRGTSLAEIIRAKVDPDELAEILLGIARSPEAKPAERAAACAQLYDRGWGRPLSPVDIKAEVSAAPRPRLPSNWRELPLETRRAFIEQVKLAAAAGTVAALPVIDAEAEEVTP